MREAKLSILAMKLWQKITLGALMAALIGFGAIEAGTAAPDDDDAIARSLAAMLRAGRAVVSNNQARINDPNLGDKGLGGKEVLAEAVKIYTAATGSDPTTIDPVSRQGRLLRAQMDAIVEVMDANQATINAKGTAFKGFIPAIFGRLVNEAFAKRAGGEATVKVTAPLPLVRNRTSRPDPWENGIITTKLLAPGWPVGQIYAAMAEAAGRPAFRMMVPEYYVASCLSCHGSPKGEMDITGYPKEGGHEKDLGGVISIVLYK